MLLIPRIQRMVDSYLTSQGAANLLPAYEPDVCVVNYYSYSASRGKLGPHQENSEDPQSRKKGYPVISFSIGDSAEFLYGNKRIPEEKLSIPGSVERYEKVTLASGDVLLFGGPSRMIFHGIERILPNTKPKELFMKQGRLNLTFRKL